MPDPVALTSVVLGAAAAVTSALTPIVLARRRTRKERDGTTIASWSTLNEALGRENARLEAAATRQAGAYERRLTAQDERIAELESEVATLQRLVRARPE